MSFIELKNIGMTYGKGDNSVRALSNINLSVDKGDFISIMGKSGCGKSTLLNILGQITRPTEGQYIFNGEDISSLSSSQSAKFRNRNLGFVVQHFALIPDITVHQNIALPMIYQNYRSKQINNRVDELLELLEISDKKDKYPFELSGGQCQRVAIARAIGVNPGLLLADEPTGAIDEATGIKIMEIFKKLNSDGMTILLVTHDKDIANYCNKQLVMRDGCLE